VDAGAPAPRARAVSNPDVAMPGADFEALGSIGNENVFMLTVDGRHAPAHYFHKQPNRPEFSSQADVALTSIGMYEIQKRINTDYSTALHPCNLY
jgi:hypothetical protein